MKSQCFVFIEPHTQCRTASGPRNT